LQLDPQNAHLHLQIGGVCQALLDHEAADHHFDRSIALAPDGPDAYIEKAANIVAWRGAVVEARAVLESAPHIGEAVFVFALAYLDRLDRDFEAAAARLATLEPAVLGSPYATLQYYLDRGRSDLLAGQVDRARLSFKRGKELAVADTVSMPRQPFPYVFLATYEAFLGNRREALEAVARFQELSAIDKYYGGQVPFYTAGIYVVLGDHAAAIEQLSQALQTPCFNRITPHHLRLQPHWDPLRDDPEFAQLIATDPDS
jgi:serine/threonine-protein kinase